MKHHTPKQAVLNSEKELNQYLLDSFGNNLKQAIKSTVQLLVRAEMETMRKDVHDHLQFNGNYGRHLLSPIGKIDDIPIPRFRTGNRGYDLQTMRIFAEEKESFYNLVAHLHAAGISQRKVDKLCKLLFGKAVAPKTTKHVFEELLQQEAFQVNQQPLSNTSFDYLYLDGLWQTVQGSLTGEVKDQVVLAASGYNAETDTHTFLGFSLASAEDAASWRQLLTQLRGRGIDFDKIKLIVLDGAQGLLAALEEVAPGVPVQMCIAHRYRNVLKHTGYRNKRAIADDLKRLTISTSREEFLEKAKRMEQRWQVLEPRAMKSLAWNLHLSVTYFMFSQDQWKHIRTTNKLERSFREIRRRTALQNHHFQSNQSATKYLTAAMASANNYYQLTPRSSFVHSFTQ